MRVMKIVLIDNNDSFTWNLVHFIGDVGFLDVEVIRNDAKTAAEIMAEKPDAIVLSPGPGTPDSAGICMDLIKIADDTPILGVCLGHQSIAQAFGAKIIRAPAPVHGKTDAITHDGSGVFKGLPSPFTATRYHSLIVSDLPDCLNATANTGDIIMGVSHKTRPVHGVQFHPEGIATQHGHKILKNFLEAAV